MAFGIAHEGPGEDGIVDLLIVERFAGNVDGLEPLQFLRCFTLAHIHGQLIVENSPLYVCRLVEEVLELIGELARHVFAEGEGALLTVHHLIGAFGIVGTFHPVHHVERVAVQNGGYHRLLFMFVVDELTLVGRAYIEPTVIASHSLFLIVHVTTGDVTYSHFYLLNCHHGFRGCLLRIIIRA